MFGKLIIADYHLVTTNFWDVKKQEEGEGKEHKVLGGQSLSSRESYLT